MAFCAHVDNNGNEIERVLISGSSGHSGRSGRSGRSGHSNRSNSSRQSGMSFSTTDSDTMMNLSSRTYSKKSTFTYASTLRNGMSSSDSGKEEQSSDLEVDASSWDGESGTCSGAYELTESENRSDVIPPLEISAGSPSWDQKSYVKNMESINLNTEQNAAYNTWLSGKMKSMLAKQEKTKKEREAAERQKAEREAQAKAGYEEWLNNKLRRQAKPKTVVKPQPQPVARRVSPETINPQEAKRRMDAWKNKKDMAKEKMEKNKIREEEQRRRYEVQRKEKSKDAWNKWIVGAEKRPKPVPLNQGIQSLRGTVSNIFVNPNEWKSILDD